MQPLSLDHIAATVHMGKYHFCRLFHQLLLTTTLSLDQIAAQTGFSSSSHLSRAFKQIYKMTPQEFKKLLRT